MRILFMGTPDYAVKNLEKLVSNSYNVVAVVTQPDKPKGRSKKLQSPPVKIFAENNNIPVLQPIKITETENIEYIKSLNIDLIVTAAYGQILSKQLLDIPKLGCINVHASLLPKYRGGAPIHWAIIKGEKETGVTIMYMEEGLDSGAIISSKKTTILDSDNTGILYDRLSELGADLLIETLPLIENNQVKAIEQVSDLATYAYNINRRDELIDWSKPAQQINNLVRGLNPWPGAYTILNEVVVKVWATQLMCDYEKTIDKQHDELKSGTIIGFDKRCPVVKTGSGYIKLLEIQPFCKNKMSADNYTNCGKFKLYDVLD